MNRREFLTGALVTAGWAGCRSMSPLGGEGAQGRMLLGVCTSPADAPLLKAIGYDFYEWHLGTALAPELDDEWWKRRKDEILAAPLPLRSCNGFIPGSFRLTGPKADHAPALDYAEKALRRADEVGIRAVVFGSGAARNVPGDLTAPTLAGRPDVQRGAAQYAEFCRALVARVADLKTVQVVIEPLCPNESNIVNYVWQGQQICEDVNSPRLALLADFYHMNLGREPAESIVHAGGWIRHCHIAYADRAFPNGDPRQTAQMRAYFDALRTIGYTGGVSCECGWGDSKNREKTLTVAFETLKGLI